MKWNDKRDLGWALVYQLQKCFTNNQIQEEEIGVIGLFVR